MIEQGEKAMSFDDEDLKQLKDFLETKIVNPKLDPSGEETIAFKYKMNALLARLDAAEKVCRLTNDVFRGGYILDNALDAWLKSAGKPQGERTS